MSWRGGRRNEGERASSLIQVLLNQRLFVKSQQDRGIKGWHEREPTSTSSKYNPVILYRLDLVLAIAGAYLEYTNQDRTRVGQAARGRAPAVMNRPRPLVH